MGAVQADDGRNLGALFQDADPSREAIVDLGAQPARSLTYGELNELCDAFARGLKRRSIGTGDRVAILSLNRAEYIIAVFGAMRLGAVPVLVNIKLPKQTVAYILNDSAAKIAFAEPAFSELCASRPTVLFGPAFDAFLDSGSFEPAPVRPGQLSMLLYTSGTTGKPKGVLLHHRGQTWAAHVLTQHRRITAADRILISAPFYHKNAIVAIKTALWPQACLIILPRFDAKKTIAAIDSQGLTMLTGVPTMMNLMLTDASLGKQRRSTVRVLSMGSSPASDQLLHDLQAAFPQAEIHLNYGSTEGGPIMFGWYHPEGLSRPLHTVGYPIPGCDWQLVGGREDEGELWVKNPGVADGYLNLSAATASRFENGWYKTGDVMHRDSEGWFYFVSRIDDMFVSGGENVYPQEVEALLERHPAVQQAAVIAQDHAVKGQVPVAFVVLHKNADADEEALKVFTLEHGPAYAHPRRIVMMSHMPLTGTNKIDRKALTELVTKEEIG